MRLKIFVSAYACEPGLGSEIGVGWHWVLEMNKYFELWVLTRERNRPTIEPWLEQNPLEHPIHFIYYDTPYWMRWWKKGLRGVRTYYVLWQLMTNSIVKDTMKREGIEIFHHLTYGNALLPVSKFGQKKFFVWGPIGGVETISSDYSRHYSIKWRCIEAIRRMAVRSLSLNWSFRTRCKNANLILCKSSAMHEQIPKHDKNKAQLFTDVAVELKNVERYISHRDPNDSLIKYIVVGRLDAWRGFDILIEAFAIAYKNNKNIRLTIIGKGDDKARLSRLIAKLGISDCVEMVGQLTMDDYFQRMVECDVVCNPCLKEGAVTTAFDSMSFGKPLICVDTGGYTHYFNNKNAFVIQKDNRQVLIAKLAEAIVLATDSEIRKVKISNIVNDRMNNTWSHKGEAIYKKIMETYDRYKSLNS